MNTKRRVSFVFTEVMTSWTNRNGGLLRSFSVRTDLRIPACPSKSCVFFEIAESISWISAIPNAGVSAAMKYADSCTKSSTRALVFTNHRFANIQWTFYRFAVNINDVTTNCCYGAVPSLTTLATMRCQSTLSSEALVNDVQWWAKVN